MCVLELAYLCFLVGRKTFPDNGDRPGCDPRLVKQSELLVVERIEDLIQDHFPQQTAAVWEQQLLPSLFSTDEVSLFFPVTLVCSLKPFTVC